MDFTMPDTTGDPQSILIARPEAIMRLQKTAELCEANKDNVKRAKPVGHTPETRTSPKNSPGPLFRLIRCFKNSPDDDENEFSGVIQNASRGILPGALEKARQPWNEAMESTILACIDHIEEQGIDEERPFAVSACQDEVESLRIPPNSKLPPDTDIHVACAVIKSLIRNATEPLIPREVFDHYEANLMTSGPPEERSFATSYLLQTLELVKICSPSRGFVLSRMMQLLAHTSARIHVTRMDAHNLSICLTPSMLQWNPNDEQAILKLSRMTQFVVVLIEESRLHSQSLSIYSHTIRSLIKQ